MQHGLGFTTLRTQVRGNNQEAKSKGDMIDGASAAENRYVVDGMETTSLFNGLSGQNVLADFVEEVQVKSSGYPAEYGGGAGGGGDAVPTSGPHQNAPKTPGSSQGRHAKGHRRARS